MNKKILWVVTARSGSKSVPHKNIKLLGGVPLLAYRIKCALKIAAREDVWISTDSPEYANIAEKYGATVPFLRPAELATDTARSADVILHAMQWAESKGKTYDAVGMLEPTSPFVTTANLFNAVERLFGEKEAENIVAVRYSRPSTFYIQENHKYLETIANNIMDAGLKRRQDEKEEITPSGGFYISKWGAFKKNHSFYTSKTLSFLVPDLEGLEIDEPIDWEWAEFLLSKKKFDLRDLDFNVKA